jgi:hypothetical protein
MTDLSSCSSECAVQRPTSNVDPTAELPKTGGFCPRSEWADVLPGLVNTHHHLNQTLFRNLPAAQNNNFFPWPSTVQDLEPPRSLPRQHALAELAMFRVYDLFDHSHLSKAATASTTKSGRRKEIGVRFHAGRESMSLGESKGLCRRRAYDVDPPVIGRPIDHAIHEGSRHTAGRRGKPRFGRSLTLPSASTITSTIED